MSSAGSIKHCLQQRAWIPCWLYLCTVSEAEVADDLAADRLKPLLLPHEHGACDGVAALHAVVALRRGAAQQVQHQHSALDGVQRRPRPPEF